MESEVTMNHLARIATANRGRSFASWIAVFLAVAVVFPTLSRFATSADKPTIKILTPSSAKGGSATTQAGAGQAGARPDPNPSGKSERSEKSATDSTTSSRQNKARTAPKEELFVGWPKPDIAFVLTGRQNGYIEPCGCTGLVNQKGGLSRRHTFIRELADRGWNVVPLDVGNLVKRFGRQSAIKFNRTVTGLTKMNYQAIGLGPDDLRLPSGELIAVMAAGESKFVSANLEIVAPEFTPLIQVMKQGGRTIGVTAILGTDEQKKLNPNDEIKWTPPTAALPAALAKLKAAKCDIHVLLAHATIEESRELAKKFPDFHLVITAGGADEPAYEPETVSGTSTWLVQVGAKGMYAGVVGVYGAEQPFRYQRVPLDSRFKDSPDMLRLLAEYQQLLKTEGLTGLGLKPITKEKGQDFVGSKRCADCHTSAWEVYENTPHSHATDTLVHPPERSDVPRIHDPECISCHVTGWEPQKMVPLKSGYLGLDKTPHLAGVGCENCHGPGSAHVQAEEGTSTVSDEERLNLRLAMRLPLAKAEQKCLECHDIDNSPAFQHEGAFERYWKKIEHKGKD